MTPKAKGRRLDPYTLRLCAKDMAAKSRDHVYRGRHHGPSSYARGFHNGAASALDHEVQLNRFLARALTRQQSKLRKK